jgi:hypothetical protein
MPDVGVKYRITRDHLLHVRLSALAGYAVHRMTASNGSSRSKTSNRHMSNPDKLTACRSRRWRSQSLRADLAFAMGYRMSRFKCRCADCFSFRAVHRSQAVRFGAAIAAIEVCEFSGEFVTQVRRETGKE